MSGLLSIDFKSEICPNYKKLQKSGRFWFSKRKVVSFGTFEHKSGSSMLFTRKIKGIGDASIASILRKSGARRPLLLRHRTAGREFSKVR
jgi:hypothetical protein